MKNNLFKSAIAAICAVVFVGCYVDKPREKASELVINGTITNEDRTPIESIKVSIDEADLNAMSNNKYKWWRYDDCYSEQDGTYSLVYTCGVRIHSENWPAEISITAEDATGTYDKQTKSFPIELIDESHRRTDGLVTADFVMKKKK